MALGCAWAFTIALDKTPRTHPLNPVDPLNSPVPVANPRLDMADVKKAQGDRVSDTTRFIHA